MCFFSVINQDSRIVFATVTRYSLVYHTMEDTAVKYYGLLRQSLCAWPPSTRCSARDADVAGWLRGCSRLLKLPYLCKPNTKKALQKSPRSPRPIITVVVGFFLALVDSAWVLAWPRCNDSCPCHCRSHRGLLNSRSIRRRRC